MTAPFLVPIQEGEQHSEIYNPKLIPLPPMKYTQVFRMLTIVGLILAAVLSGVKIYAALQPPAATSAPATPPIPAKKTYTLTWTSEVVVNDKK